MLDVGCGSGDMMKCLSPKEWQVEGCDFDEGAVKQCQRTGIDAKQGDIYEGNYASESFDVVTLNHVIEHLYRTEDVLKECLRILKPGGRLVMATPNGQSRLFKRFGGSWISLHVPAHIQIFNVDNLSEVLSKTEFIVKKSRTTCRNEHWGYAVSSKIKQNGRFMIGKENRPRCFYCGENGYSSVCG